MNNNKIYNKLYLIKLICTTIITILCSTTRIDAQSNGYLYDLEKAKFKHQYTELEKLPFKSYYCYNYSYDKGFVLQLKDCRDRSEASFNLDKKYSHLSFILHYKENYKNIYNDYDINIIGDDSIILTIKPIYMYGPVPFIVNVRNVSILKIEFIHNPRKKRSYEWIEWDMVSAYFLDPKLYFNNTNFIAINNNQSQDSVQLIADIKPTYRENFDLITNSLKKRISDLDYIDINGIRHYYGLLYHNKNFYTGVRKKNIFACFDLKTRNFKTLEFNASTIYSIGSRGFAKLIVLGDNNLIYTNTFSAGDFSKTISVDISNYRYISFILDSISNIVDFAITNINAFTYNHNDIIEGTRNDCFTESWIDVISKINLNSFYSYKDKERNIYNGLDTNRSILIDGKKYTKGLVLYRANEDDLASSDKKYNKPVGLSYASFNFNQNYDSISFSLGWLQNNNTIGKDTLKIYSDTTLIKEILLHPMMKTKYTIHIPTCNILSFVLDGIINVNPQPAYGIVELFAHKKGNNTTPLKSNNYNIIENYRNKPFLYITNKPTNKERIRSFYNIEEVSHIILNNGDSIFTGIELKSNYRKKQLIYNGEKFNSAYMASSFYHPIIIHYDFNDTLNINKFTSLVQYDKERNAYSHACACYNLDNQYDSIKFTIGASIGNNFGLYEDNEDEVVIDEYLYLVCDKTIIDTIKLNKKMDPTTINIDINKCDKLMFYIPCIGPKNNPYTIYDIIFYNK